MSTLTMGELFAGIGGFSLAGDRAGMTTLWSVEIDPIARSVLARHWPDVTRYEDVTTVSGHDLAPVDVITAGFPCQDLSVAGKRAGLEGARSGLFWEITRIVTEMREATGGRSPTVVVLENVPGLVSADDGRAFAHVIRGLGECGCLAVGWRILDAQYFRIPQRRRRIFLVGDLGGRRSSSILALADGLSGHPAPRREAGQAAPASPSGGSGSGGGADLAHALRGRHNHSHREDSDTIVAFDWQASAGNDESWRGKGRQHIVRSGDYAGALSATRVDAVGYQATGDAYWREGVGPLAASDDNGSNHVVAVDIWNHTIDENVSTTLQAYNGSKAHVLAASDDNGSNHVVASAITASAGHHGHSSPRGDGSDNLVLGFYPTNRQPEHGNYEDVSPTLKVGSGSGGNPPGVLAFSSKDSGGDVVPTSPTLRAMNYDQSHLNGGGQVAIANTMTVRRLTPLEASRLQAYPDGWIPDTIADSHHYRLLGNSVCIAVVEWLMRRVVAAMTE